MNPQNLLKTNMRYDVPRAKEICFKELNGDEATPCNFLGSSVVVFSHLHVIENALGQCYVFERKNPFVPWGLSSLRWSKDVFPCV